MESAKKRLKDEGDQSVTFCNQLKMKSHKDGKYYKTDVARQGGEIAWFARQALESRIGKSVISNQNAVQLNQVFVEMIESVASTEQNHQNG